MNPVDFKDLAVYLHRNPGDYPEASRRTCIGRLYYSAFLLARNKAGIKNSSGSVHQEVINFFLSKKNRKLSNHLKDLLAKRSDADYNMNKSFSDRDTALAIMTCQKIISAIEA